MFEKFFATLCRKFFSEIAHEAILTSPTQDLLSVAPRETAV